MKRRIVSHRRSLVDPIDTMEYLVRKGYTLSGADERSVSLYHDTDREAYINMGDPRAYLIPEEKEDGSVERRLRRVLIKRVIPGWIYGWITRGGCRIRSL